MATTWIRPNPTSMNYNVGLNMMNSLTREKEPFVTMDGDRHVRWYMCGPTVYDASHMGHARTYLGFDIIRRILTNYFGYNVTLCMNITDIDDKIIDRANTRGISITELSRKYEQEFHEDMEQLNVLPPDVLTRVTEYMDDIVTYINDIIVKGLAYESNGSVYFAVEEFSSAANHQYCKLCPEQVNNAELLAEGEGKLTQEFTSDKRSPRDFALWKKSKSGEPSWSSPWGEGRPGWHIECSVMASDVFTQMGIPDGRMDIHSGGVDLKFPHHDNEMAQAEAHSGCAQWVNYFVHSGHLHIQGLKMSKSLKNFITIRQALEINTARQIRFCFLKHQYNAPMDYGDNTLRGAMDTEKKFVEFFHNVKAALRNAGGLVSDQAQRWGDEEFALDAATTACMKMVDKAFRDDFDTPGVLTALSDLIKDMNKYLEAVEISDTHKVIALVVRRAGLFVTKILKVLGLIPDNSGVEMGFPFDGTDDVNREEALAPILDVLMSFRSTVRDAARAKDMKGVLTACDEFRDDDLPPLGIRLEDKTGTSVWKLEDAAKLVLEREQAIAQKLQKEEEKRKAVEIAKLKEEAAKISPIEYMTQILIDVENIKVKKYSKFGEDGMPTHFHDGEELKKNQLKTAKKEFSAQKKANDKYMKKLEQQK